MGNSPDLKPFDEHYFSSGAYSEVSFARFSQYWWSNRFYALLAKRFGPSTGRLLEVGCGMGDLLQFLQTRYAIFGTDINPWALAQAQNKLPQGNFLLVSAEDLRAFPQAAFQIVIAKHVIEHLQHPDQAISEMSRVLAPGGLLVLATPNLDSAMRLRKKDKWIGYKDPTHISLRPPHEWLEIIKKNQLKPFRVFADGFWDAPYFKMIPTSLQKVFFGLPGGLQALFGWSIIPPHMGESLIVLATKQ
jgi:ubiquinone/menaquinone biosynthesis C-methylase UbiE